jgi:hypothetical protein
MSIQNFFGAANWISYTAGAFDGDGAYTLATLMQPSAAACNILQVNSAVPAALQAMLRSGGAVFGNNDFSSGFAGGAQDVWSIVAQTKAAGSAPYRWHVWPYASDGSGTMSHGSSVGAANQANFAKAATIDVSRFSSQGMYGLMEIMAAWDRELTDVELETLKSNQLSKWLALSPDFLVEFHNWNGTTGDTVAAGTSTKTGVTGSLNVGADPTGFDFTTAPPPSSGPNRNLTVADNRYDTFKRQTAAPTRVMSVADLEMLYYGYPAGKSLADARRAFWVPVGNESVMDAEYRVLKAAVGTVGKIETINDLRYLYYTGA